MRLEGKVCVITGAGGGMGREAAILFTAEGAKVCAADMNLRAAEETVGLCAGDAFAFQANVAEEADVKAMMDATVERFGGIDVLCANAGVFPDARLEDMTEEDIDAIFATNVKGMMLSIKACLPALERSGHARVVLTSSITGPITGYPGWSHYGATKAAQLGFLRTAAIELAGKGITINAVMPGNIETEGLDELGPEYRRKMESSIPQRKLGTVEDIGFAALFLATDEASYITGQTIVIDGGQVLPESMMALEAG
jgi:3-oxoacyl-[acyl-carrier protein] reductase